MLKKLLHSLPMGILLALSLCSTVFAAEVNPATGDNSKIGLVFIILGISLVAVIAFVIMSIRKNKK
ncbi:MULTISPECIES: LPXTG cell wall anchor domain-containing protein [Oscillospiraceae]|uniref:LPXTG-motif cell wall-anchored protein/predicted secreted protein n=1 Tax=Harryflintia acetispora TaxID=1849041 RepID=A0A9X8Y8Q6_9FIRM|nr:MULTISPECIES: LPXTG cell wall anchor domain-containing protein [Oscillospiraceae]RGB67580.1 sortase B protein-sorting domain-containing protein [Harryflintia acetispora]TCL44062.1 LPXTG-motif cell wall-anchored protein/predicted secreted protein [Harryflintia acetispora]